MSKRFPILALAATLVFSMIGCGKTNDMEPSSESVSVETSIDRELNTEIKSDGV